MISSRASSARALLLLASLLTAAELTNGSRHIIVLTIGERPWFDPLVRPRLEQYAGAVNATLEVIRQEVTHHTVESAWGAVRDGEGGRARRSCVSRLLAAHRALETHEQVLVLDDTTYVKPFAADVFEACAGAAVCGYSEGNAAGAPALRKAWNASATWLTRTHGVSPRPAEFLNTGVLVLGRAAREPLLGPAALAEAIRRGLWSGDYPEQEYVAARAVALRDDPTVGVRPASWRLLDEGFNFMLVRPESDEWEAPLSPLLMASLINPSIHFLHIVREARKQTILLRSLPTAVAQLQVRSRTAAADDGSGWRPPLSLPAPGPINPPVVPSRAPRTHPAPVPPTRPPAPSRRRGRRRQTRARAWRGPSSTGRRSRRRAGTAPS